MRRPDVEEQCLRNAYKYAKEENNLYFIKHGRGLVSVRAILRYLLVLNISRQFGVHVSHGRFGLFSVSRQFM